MDMGADVSITMCRAKVREVQRVAARRVSDEDVVRFDIAVNKVTCMDCLEPCKL